MPKKVIPMPPPPGQIPIRNPIAQPTPFGPANTGPIPVPQQNPAAAGEAILNANGAFTRPDGSIKIKGKKEQNMNVVKLSQSMFSPNLMSMPPVKGINNTQINMGTGPAMDNSGAWGQNTLPKKQR
jgi:hypothetical protein